MARKAMFAALATILCLLAMGCGSEDYSLQDQNDKSLSRLHTDRTYIRDEAGRYVYVHGVNVSGTTKLPFTEDPISYTGRPFPLEEADWNFTMLKEAGFNVLRFLVIWEAIEPYASGVYDEEYLDYVQALVAKANEHGLYVFLDMHQDMFSRHLHKWYNDDELMVGFSGLDKSPSERNPGPYNNKVQGDGAPRWAVQTILFNKNVSSPEWGFPKYMTSSNANYCDMLPTDPWGVNYALSIDLARCFATFFAGHDIYPNWYVEGKNVKDYLQDSYTNAWLQLVRRVKDYPNVIGYDIMNEPQGVYFILTLYALFNQEITAGNMQTVPPERAEALLDTVLLELIANGMPRETIELLRAFYLNNDWLPTTPEKIAMAGFPVGEPGDSPYRPDISAVFGLNSSFNRNYLQPFHEKVGQAIVAEDPDAIIFIEESLGLGDGGVMGWYMFPMLKPKGIEQVVFAPHYYADVYPFVGIDAPPRDFTVEEVKYRDYTDPIKEILDKGAHNLSNIPVILGEYGTYFNLGGIEKAMAENFAVSTEIIDNYYETFEHLMMGHTQWCYSANNTVARGDGWNEEDFSILGSDKKFRAGTAFMRPYPRYAAGRPLAMHFNSDHHYYDSVPGRPDPYHEYYLELDARETTAPTEIFVPPIQYPEGFYVYLSDGWCAYDDENTILYWYLDDDDPGAVHSIRLRPPFQDYGDSAWDYFFDGDVSRENGRQK